MRRWRPGAKEIARRTWGAVVGVGRGVGAVLNLLGLERYRASTRFRGERPLVPAE